MAHPGRNQEHLGVDANAIVAYLDEKHPSHGETYGLKKVPVALNSTTIHEAYHTLVFKMKWAREEAAETLRRVCTSSENRFINQTLKTTEVGLSLAVQHNLGGRDALILASFLSGGIPRLTTLDSSLLGLRVVKHGKAVLSIVSVKEI